MKKLSIILITLTLVVLLAAGCTPAAPEVSSPTTKPAVTAPIPKPAPTGDLSTGTGMIEFYVTDPPPPDFDEVWVDIETLEIHKTGGNWTSINVTDADPFPLINLAINDIEEFLGSQIVEVGKYTQIRLGLGSVMIEANGANHTARVPSDKIKLVGNFNVTENNNTKITLDFNGEKSVIQTGKGEYIFKPVIKLSVSDKGKPPEDEQDEADLQILKSDSPDPVITGDNITYTLEVENLGPDDATNVTVTDNLTLAEVAYQSHETDNGTASYNGTSGIFTWDIGDLAFGATANLTILVAPLSSGNITNTASVSGDEDDPTPGNNSADADTEVTEPSPPTPEVNLAISKTGSPDPVYTSDNITYTLEVENLGPDDATNVTVTDNLTSANVTYLGPQSFNTDNGTASYDFPSGIFTWDIGDLAVGATANLTLLVQAPSSSGNITNTASVLGGETDPDPTNNSASDNTTVNME